MTTVQDILRYIETVAPVDLKMEWDNVGLLCGRSDKEVRTILVALDPFPHVCQEAVEVGADLLVTHHPLIFEPLNSVSDQTATGRAIMTLLANDISAVNAHTNLDCAEGGVNDTLAKQLELTDISVIGNAHLLRAGNYESTLPAFIAHVKTQLGCQGLRYVSGGKSVCRVAVGGGSCGSELAEVMAAGCDTFVTADVKYNQFWDAKEMGVNLIDAGHFHTENPVCAVLTDKLQKAFPDVHVILSKKHADCVNFY
ncbi:MAG: Nif3-like dinuclear metal center hexameric protein [Oscillospiraceae bacterium]|nr:Nif3-like dinuclear metal center hexameric protein [Oscillospiraceae bacterium]